MLKNKILVLMTVLMLAFPVCAEEAGIAPESDNTQNVTETTESVNEPAQEENTDITEPVEDSLTTPYKQPASKKKIVIKFFFAMLGVAVSSLIIYSGLTVYNRLRDGFVTADKSTALPPEDDKSLVTPQNLSDAVKTFVEKTNWE